jgi:hypothetical protein
MIPYDELCAALDAFVARKNGTAPPLAAQPDDETMHGQHPPQASLDSDESTHVGGPLGQTEPVYEDASNELDLGDVIPDDDASV